MKNYNISNKVSLSKKLFFIPLLLIIFLLSGCNETLDSNADKVKNEPDIEVSEVAEEVVDEVLFEPEISVESFVDNEKLTISGKTNLPDDTVLLITTLNTDGEKSTTRITVKSSEFVSEPIPLDELKSGKQTLEVALDDNQPESVEKIVGDNNKLLSGPLIKDNKLVLSSNVDIPKVEEKIQGITTKVTRVVDGDTIKTVINGKEESVRLILVDTPETKHPQMGVQPFGPEASEFTTKQLEGKEVTLELGVQERDQYGRVLAYVWIGDKLFNNTLIEKGLARVAVYPPNTKYLDEFNATQDVAKKKAIGIWSIENYATDSGYKETEKKTKVAAAAPKKETKASVAPKKEAKQAPAQTQKPTQDPPTKQPASCEGQIKGSQNGIYHVPGSTYYNRTKNVAQWFCSVEDAEKAGYRAPKR